MTSPPSPPACSPHIFTLTGNLLAERTLEFETWAPGRTQRARRETFQVGGKGINVSKMLTRLQIPNTALAFAGGAPGVECEAWLQQRGFSYRTFPTSAGTRSGLVVRDDSGQVGETTLLGPDVAPDAAAVAACAAFLEAQPDGQVLALCGSFPGWTTREFDPLRASFERWLKRGALVADTYGPPLAWVAAHPLALVKINVDELRSLPGASLDALPENVRHWIVTDGGGPVRFRTRGGPLQTETPPAIREVSPTGSGDVLFAAVIAALFCRGFSLTEAVRAAIPYAAANAAHPGVAEFELPVLQAPQALQTY